MKLSFCYQKIFLSLSIGILLFVGSGGYYDMYNVDKNILLKFLATLISFSLSTYISFHNRFLKYIHIGVMVTILIYSYIGMCYGPPSALLLESLLETNKQETLEFFLNINYLYLLPTFILFFIIVLFAKIPITSPDKKGKRTKNVLLGIIYFVLMYTSLQYPNYGFFRSIKYTVRDYNTYLELVSAKLEDYTFTVSKKQNYKKNKFYIVIIGESVRRDYLSLYGYPYKTTPFLENTNGTFFSNYISAAPNTIPSLQLSLTVNKMDLKTSLSKNIVNLAKSGGYRTHWLSNQGASGEDDILISKIGHSSNDVNFLKLGYADSRKVDDFSLFPLLQKVLHDSKKGSSEVIFIHMFGSHVYTCNRLQGFPRTFKISNDEGINCYLDTILKLDTFIKRTKEMLDQTSANYSIIYFSDHGLAISTDTGMQYNAAYKGSYSVPFFILDSDARQREFINEPISAMNFPSIFANWLGLDVSHVQNIKQINRYQELSDPNVKVFNWHNFVEYNLLKDQASVQ